MADYYVLNEKTLKHFKPIISDYFWDILIARDDFFAIGAVSDAAACGYMIVERNEVGYVIHDIFVHPDFRRKGIGTGMIHMLVDIAEVYVEDIDCGFTEGEDKSFRQFLASTGLFDFDDDTDSKVYKGPIESLYESKYLKPLYHIDPHSEGCVDFYDELYPSIKKQFIKDCMEKDYLPIYLLPAVRDADTRFCYAALNKDKSKVCAFIKMNVIEDTAHLESVWCRKNSEKRLLVMLAHISSQLKKEGKVRYLEACVADDSADELLNRLDPGLEVVAKGYNAYWNYVGVDKLKK